MFRVVKVVNGRVTEVIAANESEAVISDEFLKYATALPAGDSSEAEDISSAIKIDRVDMLSDEEIVKRGGGVCAHCHSDNTDPSMPKMGEGFVTRNLTCEVCGENTEEYYPLAGTVE